MMRNRALTQSGKYKSQRLKDRPVRKDAKCDSPVLLGLLQETRMNEQDFTSKLTELMGEISALPAGEREKLTKMADQTRQSHEQAKQTVTSLQESLDYLRLNIKYLVFDLEATRRENGLLRKMLEQASNNGTTQA